MCSGKLVLAVTCLRRVGIKSSSCAAAPTQVSTVVTPPAPAAQNLGVKKSGGGGAETLPQQVINNSAAVQQERLSMRLYVCSCNLILAAMYLRRVEIENHSYAAAPTQVLKVVTPPAPEAQQVINNSAAVQQER